MKLSQVLNQELNGEFVFKPRKSQRLTRRKTAITKMLVA